MYFWRAHVVAGSQIGPSSNASGFAVGPQVVLGTPVQVAPAANGTVGGQPTLTVNNVTRSGSPGTLVYRFEVSTSTSFASPIAVATANEQGGSTTSATIGAGLGNGNYFWRAQVSDPASGVTSAFSGTSPFTVQLFNLQTANVWDNPADFKSWAETAAISSVTFTDSAILVDFDKRDGPGRWPDVGFGDGALEYTLGMCVNINGEWNCSATVQFWYGRDLEASGRPDEIGINWWYDQRWGHLLGYQPQCGETVGIYAGGRQPARQRQRDREGAHQHRADAVLRSVPHRCWRNRRSIEEVTFTRRVTAELSQLGRHASRTVVPFLLLSRA